MRKILSRAIEQAFYLVCRLAFPAFMLFVIGAVASPFILKWLS